MILYQLKCRRGHDFEAWFRDGATYDRQAAAGDVACPHCGTAKVAKAPMSPRIAASAGPALAPAEIRATEVAARILATVEGLRERVEENCEYVGDEFADEARRIHKGQAEERGIYGEASESEAEKLDEEGIEVFRLPFPPGRTKN